jgi:hypothetical protein
LGNYNVQESWRGSRDDTDARLAYHDYIYRDSRREAAQEREREDRRLALQQEDQRRRELWDSIQKQEKKERRERRERWERRERRQERRHERQMTMRY